MEQLHVWQGNEKSPGIAHTGGCVPWRLLAILSLPALLLILLAVVQPFQPDVYGWVYGVLSTGYSLTLVYFCMKDSFSLRSCFSVFKTGLHPGRHLSPSLLGLSILVFTFVQLLLLFNILVKHREPDFPSLPYYFIFGVYPCLISATLLLPAHSVSPLARLRILLDSLIIMVAVTALCYYFVLAPLLTYGEGTMAEKTIGLGFPSADLFVLFCLLLVALRSGESALRPVLLLLGVGFFIILLLHINRLYEVLGDNLHWMEAKNIAWVPAILMITASAQTLKNIMKKDEAAGAATDALKPVGASFPIGRWKSLLSLILVLGASLLIFVLWVGGAERIFHGEIAIISIGGFIVLMLLVLRQLLALYEISVLQGKLQRRNRALSLLNDLLEKQATTDALTGLPNHRELTTRLNEALEQAQKTSSTCAIIFMDIDHFKAVNDRYGHLVGDAVLCELSELLLADLRETDYAGRWGGEEFVLLLPDRELAEAYLSAERMRTKVEQHLFADEQQVRLTCSLGVAVYPYDATRREDLLKNADQAMYTAKRLGRNQTRTASEPLVLAMGMQAEAPETAEEAEMLAVVESLIAALEARDPPTGQHARRVARLSLKLALLLGLDWSQACIVGMGGLLHDLGKVAMPDAILFKHGKLSATEIEYMARHPLIGEEILAPLPSLRPVATIVRTHHEWLDGSGYPDGLQGEAIPLGARIVAVADAYDAIISHRVYRQGRASEEAVGELRKGAGRQFDLRVVEALDYLLATQPRVIVHSAA